LYRTLSSNGCEHITNFGTYTIYIYIYIYIYKIWKQGIIIT
jgi:hypothetical protein